MKTRNYGKSMFNNISDLAANFEAIMFKGRVTFKDDRFEN